MTLATGPEFYHVRCDATGCRSTFTPKPTMPIVRAARIAGWHVDDRWTNDRCPEHR